MWQITMNFMNRLKTVPQGMGKVRKTSPHPVSFLSAGMNDSRIVSKSDLWESGIPSITQRDD